MNNNDGEPAFPYILPSNHNGGKSGMSLRDYFASKAMQGIISSGKLILASDFKSISRNAYSIADRMIEERKKEKKNGEETHQD